MTAYTFVQERKAFDEKFVKTDTKRLCELASAADGLQLKSLVDLTSRALARMIEGKTPEEIRETFHLPDDLTEVFVLITRTFLLVNLCLSLILALFRPISGRKIGTIEKHN